jgi:hypothetical protein
LQEGIFASKEMVGKVYRVAVANPYSLMKGLHSCTRITPLGRRQLHHTA